MCELILQQQQEQLLVTKGVIAGHSLKPMWKPTEMLPVCLFIWFFFLPYWKKEHYRLCCNLQPSIKYKCANNGVCLTATPSLYNHLQNCYFADLKISKHCLKKRQLCHSGLSQRLNSPQISNYCPSSAGGSYCSMMQGHLFETGPHFLWRLGRQYGSHLGEEKKKK